MNRSGHLLLFLAESFRFLDGKQQLLFQLFKALIRRQIQPVKTEEQREQQLINEIPTALFRLFRMIWGWSQQHAPGVAPRKPGVLPHLLDAELLRPVTSCRAKGPE